MYCLDTNKKSILREMRYGMGFAYTHLKLMDTEKDFNNGYTNNDIAFNMIGMREKEQENPNGVELFYYTTYIVEKFLIDTELPYFMKLMKENVIDDMTEIKQPNPYYIVDYLHKVKSGEVKNDYIMEMYNNIFVKYYPELEKCSVYEIITVGKKKYKKTYQLKGFLLYDGVDDKYDLRYRMVYSCEDHMLNLFKIYYKKTIEKYENVIDDTNIYRCIINCKIEHLYDCDIDANIVKKSTRNLNLKKKTKTQLKKDKQHKKLKALHKKKTNENEYFNSSDSSNSGSSSSTETITTEDSDDDENFEYNDGICIKNIENIENIQYPFVINIIDCYCSIENKNKIYALLNDLYESSCEFKSLMENYDTVVVIKNIHRDFNMLNTSFHMTIKLVNKQTTFSSPVLHAYITNDRISALTCITNMI